MPNEPLNEYNFSLILYFADQLGALQSSWGLEPDELGLELVATHQTVRSSSQNHKTEVKDYPTVSRTGYHTSKQPSALQEQQMTISNYLKVS